VGPVAERLAEALRKVHSQHLRTLECKIEAGLLFYGEERDLMEMLGNLLDNACKYGDGVVRLEAEMLGSGPRPGLRLRVGNNGAALEPARFAELLQRGMRGDELGAAGGHGLGLSIVAELVSAYGGQLTCGPSQLGGTEVTVTIPSGYRGASAA
jgi:two-component system sensor histidine kinase PhoQ